MDIDEVQVEIEVTPSPEVSAHHAFAVQFSPFPFTHDKRTAIFSRRSFMSDELIFDLLLEQASIASPHSLYPPDSPESLLQLLDAIANCPWDAIKKSCLHFYLLCHVSPGAATKHARACALPPQFVHLAHACFLLDLGTPQDLARAVPLLSDARIVQDLSSKVLQTLSLAPEPACLLRTYVRTAQPVLEAYDDLAIYLRALMEYSLAHAWTFQRTFSETTPMRNQLIRTILDGCLIPPKPAVLPHLLSIPLTSYEFSLLQSYALSPSEELTSAAHAILQDLIVVRLLHSGKYSDAVRLSRAFDALNTKSRINSTVPLHEATEARQQMMCDVLAVVPDVQRRQLELELNDEQGLCEHSAIGASWESMDPDVTMSWENLGASGSSKLREKTLVGPRSGRLEGSPAPALSGRSNASNSPFGPYSSPVTSAQQRKTNRRISNNILSTPSAKPTPAVFPPIATPGLATPSVGTPLTRAGLRPSPRFGFGTPPQRPAQTANHGFPPDSLVRSGIGLNARNAFYEPEPSRDSSLFFRRQPQGEANTAFATSTPQDPSARAEMSSSERTGARPQVCEPTVVDEQDHESGEAMVMVDSDDPDNFVMRGRRRGSLRLPLQRTDIGTDASVAHGAPPQNSALSGLDEDKMLEVDQAPRKSSHTIPPGGFVCLELTEDFPALSTLSSKPDKQEPAPSLQKTLRQSQMPSQPEPHRLAIPGALFDDDEVEVEEHDHVPSLPPAQSKGGRRKRAARVSSVATESTDEDGPHVTRMSLRRSSRLSSTGPSPEPLSPPKEEKRPSKKTTQTAMDGIGRTARKRKNAGE